MTTLYLKVKVGNFDPVNQQHRHFETLFQEVHTQTIILYFAMAYFTRRMDNINFHTKDSMVNDIIPRITYMALTINYRLVAFRPSGKRR